jgi:hypothetical protein
MLRYISLEHFFKPLNPLIMKMEKMALDVVNPKAAGMDVGSRSHYVAIGQRDEDVKEFGV